MSNIVSLRKTILDIVTRDGNVVDLVHYRMLAHHRGLLSSNNSIKLGYEEQSSNAEKYRINNNKHIINTLLLKD